MRCNEWETGLFEIMVTKSQCKHPQYIKIYMLAINGPTKTENIYSYFQNRKEKG